MAQPDGQIDFALGSDPSSVEQHAGEGRGSTGLANLLEHAYFGVSPPIKTALRREAPESPSLAAAVTGITISGGASG